MKYIQLFISVIVLVIFLFVGYKIAKHQPHDALKLKVAIIDSDKVINESFALQNIQQQIKEQSSGLQQEFKSKLEKFKPSKEEFELLSEEAKKERTEEFDKHTLSARDNYARKMLYLEKSYRDAVDGIFNKVKETAREIAEKNNIGLVLLISKKNQVLYSMDEANLDRVDLSDAVLEDINKGIPEFTLKDLS